jgi:adenylyltransferase/sulfurtransferase
VSGAAIRFDGQIASFDLRDPQAPCYNCLFPESSEAADELCSVMGVIAPLTGTIGAMQALEAIKLLIGLQGGAETRLTLFEARDGTWRSLRIRRDPACAVCAGRTDSPAS